MLVMFLVYKSGDNFIFKLHGVIRLRGSIGGCGATAGWLRVWRSVSLGPDFIAKITFF